MKSIQGTQVERGASKGMTWGVRVRGNKRTLLFYRLLGCHIELLITFLKTKSDPRSNEIQWCCLVLWTKACQQLC